MQVSLYLDQDLVRELDRLATKRGQSRSRIAQELMRKALRGRNQAALVAESAGTWEDARSAEEIVAEIYEARSEQSGRSRPEW